MKNIYLVSSLKKARALALRMEGVFFYYSCLYTDHQTASEIQDRGGRPAQIDPASINIKNFIDAYNQVVDSITLWNNSRVCLATDLVSKNRFFSPLPQKLYHFLCILEAAWALPDNASLIVIGPGREFAQGVIDACKKNDMDVVDFRDAFWEEAAGWLLISRKFLSVFYNAARVAFRSIYARGQLKEVSRQGLKANQAYYVLKTFIYDHSFSEHGYEDVFYGCLPDYLGGSKNVFIWADVLGDFKKAIKNIKNCPKSVILPIEYHLTLRDILRAVLKVVLSPVRVPSALMFQGHDISRIVRRELFSRFKGIQIFQYLHYDALRNLIRDIPIETFLLTYENNPWERMCELALKTHSPASRVLGYQHTVTPQASLNLFPGQGAMDQFPFPDRILTTGLVPKQILEKYGCYKEGRLEAACALRFGYLFDQAIKPFCRTGKILLALEGILQANSMVEYVLDELGNNDKYQITIRTHPVCPWSFFERNFRHDLSKYSNIALSKNKAVRDDLAEADIVIYWGTTVALEALLMGIPLINFHTGDLLNYDPLFEWDILKWVAGKNTCLSGLIEEVYHIDNKKLMDYQEKARQYIFNHFYPVTDERLAAFL